MRLSLITNLVGAVFLALLSIPANAATTARTWVSGVGNDANTASLCSRTAPCATFAAALTVTSPAGEINCLDPGGFGAVTITQSTSIVCGTAGEAGVLVSGATDGITINGGSTDNVYLSGLDFEGGDEGIRINSAHRVTIQNCVIKGFLNGIDAIPSTSMTLEIKDTTVINNSNLGVYVAATSGHTVYASIDHSLIQNNTVDGVFADGTFSGAVLLGITDSPMSLNGTNGLQVQSGTGGGNAKVNVIRSSFVTNGGAGIKADQSSGGNASVIVGSSMFADDLGGAIGLVAGGTVYSLGNNQLSGPPGNSPTPLSAF
jgi:hypothetical protein